MTGDVMFHEYIKKQEEKEVNKRNQPDDVNVKDENIKTEEDEELQDNKTKDAKKKKLKKRKRIN